MTESNLVSISSNHIDSDEATKEARKKKIRELEASLFGNSLDHNDSSWNPR